MNSKNKVLLVQLRYHFFTFLRPEYPAELPSGSLINYKLMDVHYQFGLLAAQTRILILAPNNDLTGMRTRINAQFY